MKPISNIFNYTIDRQKTYTGFTNYDIEYQLRLDSGSTGSKEFDMLKVAVDLAENYIQDDIVITQNTLTISYTSVLNYGYFSNTGLELNTKNLISISSITADSKNVTDYQVEKYHSTTYINFFKLITCKELKIVYTTGLSTLKNDIKQAILIKTADLYDIERNNYMMSNYKENKVFELILNNYKNYYLY